MPWRASGDDVRTDEEVRQLYLDTYGTRRTDIDERPKARQPIEIPFGDGRSPDPGLIDGENKG